LLEFSRADVQGGILKEVPIFFVVSEKCAHVPPFLTRAVLSFVHFR